MRFDIIMKFFFPFFFVRVNTFCTHRMQLYTVLIKVILIYAFMFRTGSQQQQ